MDRRKTEFVRARQAMVAEQLETRGIRDSRVLAAMECVAREEFVSEAYRQSAYFDGALPIECDQTISQPYTVAFMCEAARVQPSDRVLEIGTGSGYGAAVLSLLAREVHTIERHSELAEQAAQRLQRLGYTNVTVHSGDGTLGLSNLAPFNAIIVTAGANGLPPAYIDQLADGGRIIIPIGRSHRHQVMYRYLRRGDTVESESLGQFAFVPLIGAAAWPSEGH